MRSDLLICNALDRVMLPEEPNDAIADATRLQLFHGLSPDV